jgi:hypothetical protein
LSAVAIVKGDGAAIVEVVGGGRDHQEQQSVVSKMAKPMPMPRRPMKGPSSWKKMMIEMPMPIGAAQLLPMPSTSKAVADVHGLHNDCA